MKKTDTRARVFVERYGSACAEVEAIPADALRDRVRSAIESHFPWREWASLQAIEAEERKSWRDAMAKIGGVK